MNIIIDSSKVPAFSLCVFKGNQKIYEELCFSGNKLEFDIGAVGENDLYFEWSFALEKNEKKALKKEQIALHGICMLKNLLNYLKAFLIQCLKKHIRIRQKVYT